MTRLAGVRRSFPTLTMPFRWIGRSRRRIWVARLTLLAMIVGPPVWWTIQLLGLPDIGDPFDVQAFRAFAIPDDRNALCALPPGDNLAQAVGTVRQDRRQPGQYAGSLVESDPRAPPLGRAEPRGAGACIARAANGQTHWPRSPSSGGYTKTAGAWSRR